MKFLCILLLLCACGKKNEIGTSSQNLLSENLDRDGDGMSDLDEVAMGRNHLIADITTNSSIKDDTFTLVDGVLNEFDIKLTPKRLVRTELLRKVLGLHPGPVSDVNKLTVDFNSSHEFWKLFHKGHNFYHYYFKVDKNQQYSLPVNFDETRTIEVNNFSDYGILEQVKRSTYRLIISTPEKEMIYYLHPSIAMIPFLKTEHAAVFSHGTLQRLGSLVTSPQIDEGRWDFVTDSLQSLDSPEAGHTYAFVFSDLREYQGSTIVSGRKDWDETFTTPFNQRVEKTIFIPSFYRKDAHSRTSVHLMDINTIEFRCTITENLDAGFKPFSASVEQIRDWLNLDAFDDFHVVWSLSSPRGTTLKVNTFIAALVSTPLLNTRVKNATIDLGITQSTCPYTLPETTPHLLYTGHKEYYLAD